MFLIKWSIKIWIFVCIVGKKLLLIDNDINIKDFILIIYKKKILNKNRKCYGKFKNILEGELLILIKYNLFK